VSGTFAGWPASFPYFAVLEIETANAEIVSVTNVSGSIATIVRGQNGTVAVAHSGGATFDQVVIAQDFDEANAHTSANTGVHGISGHVVGDSDAQTLTNKTLTSPAISNPTVTGTSNGANATLSGTLGVTGNTTLGGTLAVTGASTLTGAVTTSAGVTVGTDVTASGVKLNKPPLFIGYQHTIQSIASGSAVAVILDTEVVDSVNGHDLVTNPTRYTAQVAGYYEAFGNVALAANTTGLREARINVNGTDPAPSIWTIQNATTAGASVCCVAGFVFLNVGDYVELVAVQTSGVALNTAATTPTSSLSLKWISA
jgi:hypothetical protein